MPFRLEPSRDRSLYRLVKQSDPVTFIKGRTLYAPGDAAQDDQVIVNGLQRARPGAPGGSAPRAGVRARRRPGRGARARSRGRHAALGPRRACGRQYRADAIRAR